MIIRPNKRTRKHLRALSSHAHCSMARMAARLLQEYVNARDDT